MRAAATACSFDLVVVKKSLMDGKGAAEEAEGSTGLGAATEERGGEEKCPPRASCAFNDANRFGRLLGGLAAVKSV